MTPKKEKEKLDPWIIGRVNVLICIEPYPLGYRTTYLKKNNKNNEALVLPCNEGRFTFIIATSSYVSLKQAYKARAMGHVLLLCYYLMLKVIPYDFVFVVVHLISLPIPTAMLG